MVFIFTGATGKQHGYVDGFQPDGTFWYTGEGQRGDMELVRGNLALTTAETDGKELRLFEQAKKHFVRYVGRASLGHHESPGVDTEGQPRRMLVFEFAIEGDAVGTAADVSTVEREASDLRALKSLSTEALRARAMTASSRTMPAQERRQIVRQRSLAVREYVLRRAKGVCEGCSSPAPFVTAAGAPYLEPHHIRRIADGGPDHPMWVIALCPTCHRRVHYGNDGQEYNRKMSERIASFEELECPSKA